MGSVNRSNFGETTLAAPIVTTNGTAIVVTSGASFPAVPFLVTIDTEILKCTDKGIGDLAWTVTRGEQSSTAATHVNGTKVENNITAGDFTPLVEGPASVTADHIVQFDSTTGKLVKDGGVLGTMAAAATGDYIAKAILTAHGDLIYATASATPAVLAHGAEGSVLTVASSLPSWVAHPNHIPATGAAAQILQYTSAGTAKWITLSGDLTVADGGVHTIAASAVTLAKMADMATSSLIYRRTAGNGVPEVNTLAQLKTDLGIVAGLSATIASLASEFTTTSASFVDVTGFSVPVSANKKYLFRMVLLIKSSTTRGDVVAINGPVSPTSILINSVGEPNITGTGLRKAYDTSFAVNPTATAYYVFVDALLDNGANAGNVIVRLHGDGAGDTAKIEVGSYIVSIPLN